MPYYLFFYPEVQERTLFEFNEREGNDASVHPDDDGDCAIPELDLTVELLDGWARFWLKGRLPPIPTELRAGLIQVRKEVVALCREWGDNERQFADTEHQLADEDRQIADMQAESRRLRKSAG